MNRCTVINKNLFLTSAWLLCTISIIFPGLLYCSISMKLFVQFVKRGSGGRQLPVGSGVALRASSL